MRQIDDEQRRIDASQCIADATLQSDVRARISDAIASHLPAHDRVTAAVAPLAAVDGALVITTTLEIIGFGAKIVASKDSALYVAIAGPQTGFQEIGRASCRERVFRVV